MPLLYVQDGALGAVPVFANFSAAMAAQEPIHWWRLSDVIGGVTAAGNVTDFGVGTDPQNMRAEGGAYSRIGHDDPDEFSFKLESSGAEVRIKNSQAGETFPTDITTQTVGSISLLFRLDYNPADATPDPWRSIFELEDETQADQRNRMSIEATAWPVGQDVGYEGEDGTGQLIFKKTLGLTTNFWQAQLNRTVFDGKWHYLVITFDGTNMAFWLDGEDVTSDMVITSGGTGVDETTWWDAYAGLWNTIGLNYADNGTVIGQEFQAAHVCLFDKALTLTDVGTAWASLPAGGKNGQNQQPAAGSWVWKPGLSLEDPFHNAMIQSHPYYWFRMDEPSGRLMENSGHYNHQPALVQHVSKTILNQAGPGAALERSIELQHSGGDFAGLSIDIAGSGQSVIDDFGALMIWVYIDKAALPLTGPIPLWHAFPQITSWDWVNFWISTDGRVNWQLWDGGSASQRTQIVSPNPLTMQEWHCIIIDQSGNDGSWHMWIDGVEVTYTLPGTTSMFYWFDEGGFPNPWSTIGFQVQNKTDFLAPVAGAGGQLGGIDPQDTFRLSNFAFWLGETNNQGVAPLSASRINRGPINPPLLWDRGRGIAA